MGAALSRYPGMYGSSSRLSRSTRFTTPEPERSFTMHMHGGLSSRRPQPQRGYFVRRAASTGEVSSARKTDIIAVPTSRENSVGPSSRSKKSDANEGEKQSYYTDRYFSSNFLSDSIPLSQ